MKRIMAVLLCLSFALSAENMIKNAAMKELAKNGIPVGWNQFKKDNLQIPGADGADFTLSLPGDKDATITYNVKLKPNIPYVLSFEAKSTEGSIMNCYYEWFSVDDNGKSVYGGGASVKKQAAPLDWKSFEVSVAVSDAFHHGYVALRSMNGKALSFRNVSLQEARYEIDNGTGGIWNLERLKECYTPKGIVVRNNSPAMLYSVPVESGKSYILSYDACGRGPVDEAYPFHEITSKIKEPVQSAILHNDVTNTPQRKFHKFKVQEGSTIKHISIDFSCTTRKSESYVLFSNFSLAAVEPDPRDSWHFELLSPCFRDIIYASNPIDAIVCQVVTDGTGDYCEVTFNGKSYKKTIRNERDVRISIPVAGLPDGKYPMECKIYSKDGAVQKQYSKNVLKVPKAPNEVTAGPDRFLRINGKPFLVSYTNLRDWSEDYVYYAARHGANTALLSGSRTTETEILQKLDLAEKYGFKVIVNSGCNDGKSKAADAFRKNLEKRFSPAVRQHPALLCYFLVDEPLWRGLPAKPFQECYEILREFDPYHPIWINAAPRGEVEDLRPYADACDIWGCDIYPIPTPNNHSGLEDKMMTSVGKYTLRMNDVTYWRKPCLMVIQGFGWGENPENGPMGRAKVHPKQEEMRFMLLDAMVNGATAIEFWGSHHVKDTDYLELVFDSYFDLYRFSGLFLNGKQEADAATSNKALRASVWSCQGQRWYFIMNTTNAPAEGTVDVRGHSVSDILSWGSKITTLPTGQLNAYLRPYGYVVCGTAPLPAPPNSLPAKNPSFESKGSPLPGAIKKVLDKYSKVTKFKTIAKWIWQSQQAVQNGNVCFVAKQFKAAAGEHVELLLAVDDASTVFLNGKEIGRTNGWQNIVKFDLTGKTTNGDNLLMIRAEDLGLLPCGVLAELHVGKSLFYSDESWLGLPAKDAKSAVPKTLELFKPVTIITPYGGGAWGENVLIKNLNP